MKSMGASVRDFPSLKEKDEQVRRCPFASGLSTNHVDVMAGVEAAIVQP